MIKIKHNISQVIKELGATKQQVVKAAVRTNQECAKKVVNNYVEYTQKEYTIKTSGMKKLFRIIRGGVRRTAARIIVPKGKKGIPLIAFKSRQTTKGVSFKVSRKSGNHLLRGGFIQTMPGSGHKGVFIREGAKRVMKRGRYAGKRRQPIVEKFGPNVTRLVDSRKMRNMHREVVKANWGKSFVHNLRYYISRKGGG